MSLVNHLLSQLQSYQPDSGVDKAEDDHLEVLIVGLQFWSLALRSTNTDDLQSSLHLANHIRRTCESKDNLKAEWILKHEAVEGLDYDEEEDYHENNSDENDPDYNQKPVTLKIMKTKQKRVKEEEDEDNLDNGFVESGDHSEYHENTSRNEMIVKCDYCDKYFPSYIQAAAHVKEDHPVKMDEFNEKNKTKRCKSCSKCFYTMRSLRKHYRKFHKYQVKANSVDVIDNETDKKKCGFAIKESCPYCGVEKVFKVLKRHVREDHEEYFAEFILKECPFLCNIEGCDKRYRSNQGVRRHKVKDHNMVFDQTNEKTFSCNICGMTFERRALLADHYEQHKPGSGRLYKCPICGKMFLNNSDCKGHMKCHEDDPSNYSICDLCGKTLKNEYQRKRHHQDHRRNDTRKEAYECKKCSEKFFVLKELNKHEYEAHDKNALFCSICGFKSRSKQSLKKHQGTHKEEKDIICVLCGKTFADESYLIRHNANVHEDEDNKKFKCQECGKGFNLKHVWQGHMNMHLGLKPFKCQFCGQGYQNNSNLRAHLKKSRCAKARALT